MTGCLVLLLAVAPVATPASPGMPDDAILALAEQSFAEGVALRGDRVKAKPAFARAAIGYDELWQRGHHNADLALNRAHAHELAGDVPKAIAALHEGLAVARWNRPLQAALEDARATVAYPHTGDLVNQCRPAASTTIGTRMSPLEAWSIAVVAWCVACAGLARYVMTRMMSWLLVSVAATVLLAVLSALWFQDYRQQQRENAAPLVVVTADRYLRKGNSDAWTERLDAKLPRGVEARELSRRGGWVQVRLAGGAIGWLPETAVIVVGRME